MKRNLKIIGLLAAIANLVYLGWLGFHVQGVLGWIFFFAETGVVLLTPFFLINHWTQHHGQPHPGKAVGSVAVFLPLVNEPVEMFAKTIESAKKIDYSEKTIYILDDGHREEIKNLAASLGVMYIANHTHKNFKKSGNLNSGLAHSTSDFVLVIDADHVVKPEILNELLGHFTVDEKLSVVSTRQQFYVTDFDFNNDRQFYEHIQPGKNADNAAISTGNTVIYRRSALDAIKGFQEWSVVEDMFTTYTLHENGYKSLYVNKSYSIGTAPYDVKTIYRQRGTWSLDAFRLMIWRRPFLNSKLTWMQRSHYTEMTITYLTSAIGVPILFSLPAINVWLEQSMITDPTMYLFFRVPTFLLICVFYFLLSGFNTAETQYWAALWPVYLKSFFQAWFPEKKEIRVTEKRRTTDRQFALVMPQLFLMLISIETILLRVTLDGHFTANTGINLFWAGVMAVWFIPIIWRGIWPKKEIA